MYIYISMHTYIYTYTYIFIVCIYKYLGVNYKVFSGLSEANWEIVKFTNFIKIFFPIMGKNQEQKWSCKKFSA